MVKGSNKTPSAWAEPEVGAGAQIPPTAGKSQMALSVLKISGTDPSRSIGHLQEAIGSRVHLLLEGSILPSVKSVDE